MMRAIEPRPAPKRLAFLALALVVLSGCEESLETAQTPEEKSEKIELLPEAASGSQRDIESPDVFELTEAGLWDGRPSLGGIWVAHPDVTQPERVVIRNAANNQTVTGALFRRERDLPGPALQVSSAAAEELGMLAGAPTKINVVALRREKIQEAPPPVEEAPAATDEGVVETEVAGATASETDSDDKPAKRKWWQPKKPAATAAVAGAAGAAIATADDAAETTTEAVADATEASSEVDVAEKPTKRKWWQKKEPEATTAVAGAAVATTQAADTDAPAETSAVADAAAASDQTDTSAEAPAEKPAKRKWWQKKEPEASAVATAAAPVVETELQASASPALSDAPVVASADEPVKRKWWQKKKTDEITATPLDPIDGAAAAIESAELTSAAVPAAAGTAAAVSKPYVQIGTFAVEANANSAANKIRRNGMSADVRELKTEDKSVWRVLVGPATSRAERRAIQSDVKDLGFSDSFTVKN